MISYHSIHVQSCNDCYDSLSGCYDQLFRSLKTTKRNVMLQLVLGSNYMQCNQLDCQNSFSACKNFWTCCSETNPCQIDEGDCDSDNHCTGNLRCGVANCRSMYPSNSDCCEKKGRHFVIRNDFKSKTLTIEAEGQTLKA